MTPDPRDELISFMRQEISAFLFAIDRGYFGPAIADELNKSAFTHGLREAKGRAS